MMDFSIFPLNSLLTRQLLPINVVRSTVLWVIKNAL